MIRLKIRDTFHRLIDGYEINESSREVKFSDLKLDFTDKTIADLPLKYQECQLVDVDLEDIEQSSGYTIDGVNIRLDYDDKRNFSYRVEGNTYQETTTGKNLCKPIATATKQGMTLTNNNDGSYTLNGTASANTSFYITGLNYPAGTYTLSLNNLGTNSNGAFYIQAEATGGSIRRTFGTINGTQTGTTTNPITAWSIVVPSGLSLSNFKFKPMLESGSTAHTFEKYTGGQASPNPSYPQEVQTITGRQQISVAGKNLFDGVFRQGGSTANSTTRIYSASAIYLEAGTYTISTDLDTTQYKYANNMASEPFPTTLSNIYYDSGWKTSSSWTFNVSTAGYFGMVVATSNGSGTIVPNDMSNFHFQLESGNIATTLETNAKDYEINLGKNLMDMSLVQPGYINTTGGISGSHPNDEGYVRYIPCEPNTFYVFDIIETPTSFSQWLGIAEYSGKSESTFLRNSVRAMANVPYMFKTGANAHYLCVSGRNILNATKVQLEKGALNTSYSPYKTPIELNDINGYQDVIFKNGVDSDYYYSDLEEGAWYIIKRTGKVVLNGTETWAYSGTSTANVYRMQYNGINTLCLKPANADTLAQIVCDYYTTKTANQTYVKNIGISMNVLGNILIYDSNYTSSDTTAFKTWLSSHNVSVYYVLDTPTTTKITDEELVSQLEAVKLKNGLNKISSKLFEVSPVLHFWYNFNEAYTWSKINEIIYTGYVNNFVLPSMKNKKEYRELELELLSPLAMATLRTTDVSGRYDLKEAITNILQPLIDDGFNLIQLNVYDVPVNVNYLAETIESAMNKLSNNYNFWWYIDKNKNIYVNSINSLLAKQPLLNYTNDIQLNGLIDFTPRTNATDYCNTICFSNVRVYRLSYYKKNYNYNEDTQSYELWGYDLYYPLVDNIYKIKDDDTIEFNHPIDLYPQRTLGLESVYEQSILEIYSITNYSSSLLAQIYYDATGHLTYSNNISIDGSDNTKAFQMTLGGDNDNLITGFKYSGSDFELGRIESDFALPLLKVRFVDDIEVDKNKNIINESGVVEKIIDMNERITTYDNLLNIANSIMRKNTSNVEEIEMKFDGDLEFEVGNIVSVDRLSFLTKGKFIIIDKKIIYGDNVKNCIYTLRNTRILENYVDLFRASETYEDEEQEKTYVITANVVKEEIKESYEVENES